MHILRAFCIAFSMYSKIPVPQFEWKERDMRYMLCFFPWVGAVVGGALFLWRLLCAGCGISTLCATFVSGAILILVTGGIHVDGFMDVMDALHSYQPREKKLEILKDPHIGAFSVIMAGAYAMVYLGALSQIHSLRLWAVVSAGFFLSRCLSGIGAVSFPAAKKDGLLRTFADGARKKAVRAVLCAEGILCAAFMVYLSPAAGGAAAAASVCIFIYYYFRAKKEFGGVTGDTAGYFVLLCEAGIAVCAAVLETAVG